MVELFLFHTVGFHKDTLIIVDYFRPTFELKKIYDTIYNYIFGPMQYLKLRRYSYM